jgi:hypothetical protein
MAGTRGAEARGAPRFSVVIPTFGEGPALQRAVDSALAQTCQDLEILVVDDAGDPPAGVEDDPRVRVLTRAANGGIGAARNTGIGVARGDWLAFLDADDLWCPRRLERIAEAIDDGQVGSRDAITTDLEVRRADGSVELWSSLHPFVHVHQIEAQIRTPFLNALFAVRCDVLLELGGFDERLDQGEDSDFLLRLMLAGGAVRYVPEPLAIYHLGVGISSQRERLLRSQIAQLDKLLGMDLVTEHRRAAEERRATVVARHRDARRLRVRSDLEQGDAERAEIRRVLDDLEDGRRGTSEKLLLRAGLLSPRLAGLVSRAGRGVRRTSRQPERSVAVR